MSESGVLVANNPDGVVLRGSRGHRVPHLGMVRRRVFGLGKGRVVDWRYNLWLRPRLSLSTHADHHDRHDKRVRDERSELVVRAGLGRDGREHRRRGRERVGVSVVRGSLRERVVGGRRGAGLGSSL